MSLIDKLQENSMVNLLASKVDIAISKSAVNDTRLHAFAWLHGTFYLSSTSQSIDNQTSIDDLETRLTYLAKEDAIKKIWEMESYRLYSLFNYWFSVSIQYNQAEIFKTKVFAKTENDAKARAIFELKQNNKNDFTNIQNFEYDIRQIKDPLK